VFWEPREEGKESCSSFVIMRIAAFCFFCSIVVASVVTAEGVENDPPPYVHEGCGEAIYEDIVDVLLEDVEEQHGIKYEWDDLVELVRKARVHQRARMQQQPVDTEGSINKHEHGRLLGNPNFGTHTTPLVTAIMHTSGPVLEMGCGDYSTPMLHAILAKQGRFLLSRSSIPPSSNCALWVKCISVKPRPHRYHPRPTLMLL
jgi:hypothetical protein